MGRLALGLMISGYLERLYMTLFQNADALLLDMYLVIVVSTDVGLSLKKPVSDS